jgi:transcription termination/antitermination protein NusG
MITETTKTEKVAMKWYIVRAQANRERSIAERISNEAEKGDLRGIVGRVIVPMDKTFYMKAGKKMKREKVMYNGYVFVETSSIGELKQWIKGVVGATGFLSNRDGSIPPLSQLEVDKMLGEHEASKEKEIDSAYCIGEEVKVTEGPFSTFKGTITLLDEPKQKVTVNVLVFGRTTPLELNLMQIEKILK